MSVSVNLRLCLKNISKYVVKSLEMRREQVTGGSKKFSITSLHMTAVCSKSMMLMYNRWIFKLCWRRRDKNICIVDNVADF